MNAARASHRLLSCARPAGTAGRKAGMDLHAAVRSGQDLSSCHACRRRYPAHRTRKECRSIPSTAGGAHERGAGAALPVTIAELAPGMGRAESSMAKACLPATPAASAPPDIGEGRRADPPHPPPVEHRSAAQARRVTLPAAAARLAAGVGCATSSVGRRSVFPPSSPPALPCMSDGAGGPPFSSLVAHMSEARARRCRRCCAFSATVAAGAGAARRQGCLPDALAAGAVPHVGQDGKVGAPPPPRAACMSAAQARCIQRSCLLSAAVACGLAAGMDLPDAIPGSRGVSLRPSYPSRGTA